jgi:hypothetical protein
MTTPDEGGPGRPTGESPGESPGERRRSAVGRQERAVAATQPGGDPSPATTPGLVVTEERLADGRAITYFEVPR